AMCWTQTHAAESLRLDIATDATFTSVVTTANVATDTSTDLTVKYDVHGLRAGTRYFYRFVRTSDGLASPSGQFRTAPPPGATIPLRFVFTGDSNARHRPFRVLDF